MIAWIKRLMFDETAFVGAIRAALMGLGAAQMGGYLPDAAPQWVGILAMSGAVMIRSSSGAPKEKTQ